MPAMLDDPTSPTIYRVSGNPPYPDPHHPSLPDDVVPRQVTLRDRVTVATIVPFASRHQVPPSLLAYLSEQLNKEIEKGDTYPMMEGYPVDKFSSYWFQNFGAVMLLGSIDNPAQVVEGRNWATECLGSFYIKPNYPGRSSHVCNAGFLVTDAARNRGVGRLMGESYLEWAPKLGYTYSVFNLVYETNVASCRIWDALGFKRIGRVKGCGNLKSYPGQFIDAIIYGRDLGPEGEDYVSEDRFDKIKFYLKYGKYPSGADRAEKSRLRSAATHYKLLDNDKLMLKDKEVISDPQRQYEIAKTVHVAQHGGINKTTATIAERFHWTRIKETVSLVIKNCEECKELGKAPIVRPENGVTTRNSRPASSSSSFSGQGGVSAAGRILSLPSISHQPPDQNPRPLRHNNNQQQQQTTAPSLPAAQPPSDPYADPFHSTSTPPLESTSFDHSLDPTLSSHQDHSTNTNTSSSLHSHLPSHQYNSHHRSLSLSVAQIQHQPPHHHHNPQHHHHHHHSHLSNPDTTADATYLPLDPQIMDDAAFQSMLDAHTHDRSEHDMVDVGVDTLDTQTGDGRHHPHQHHMQHNYHQHQQHQHSSLGIEQSDLGIGVGVDHGTDGDLDMLLEEAAMGDDSNGNGNGNENGGGATAASRTATGGERIEDLNGAAEERLRNRAQSQAQARAAEAAMELRDEDEDEFESDVDVGVDDMDVGLYGDGYRDT